MGRVYAVASAKGGVGKTTTTANLGAALAAAGDDVVVVDADLGMPNLGPALGVTETPTLHDVLADEAAVADATHEGVGGVDVVPGTHDLDAFRRVDPTALADVAGTLAAEYDHVVLDAGAGLSHDSVLPVAVADEVILVTGPGRDARDDAATTREVAARLGTDVRGVVLARTPDGDERSVANFEDLDLLAVVPEDEAVAAATEAGDPLVNRDPDHPASVAYRRLAATLTDAEPPVESDAEGESGEDETVDDDGGDADETAESEGEAVAEETDGDEGETVDAEGETPDEDADGAEEPAESFIEDAESTLGAADSASDGDDGDAAVENGESSDVSGVHETPLAATADDEDEAAEKKGFLRRLFSR